MELATKRVIGIDVEDDMQKLFQIFSDKRIKKVPVLQQGKLVGVDERTKKTGKSDCFSPSFYILYSSF